MSAGKGVVEGNKIPYQPRAVAKQQDNFANRDGLDPLGKCYQPGVPRITYLDIKSQIPNLKIKVLYVGIWSLGLGI